MDDARWAKRIWEWRGDHSTWKKGVMKLERKWGTENMTIPVIRAKVKYEGRTKWKNGLERKSTLTIYNIHFTLIYGLKSPFNDTTTCRSVRSAAALS